MALRFLLDEQLRGPLARAIRQHNAAGIHVIDVLSVGDPPDLPLGSSDPGILLWAEREGRIVVTWDRGTMPGHLASHLLAGHHSPGVFVLRSSVTLSAIVSYLVLAAHAGDPALFQDRIEYVP
jgi:hypothetical protein